MKILLVKLSPVESINSAMYRTLALARGLVENGNQVDMLVIPDNEIEPIGNVVDKVFFQNINIFRTGKAKTSAWKTRVEKKRTVIRKMLFLTKKAVRKLSRSVSVYNGAYLIARRIKISTLPGRRYDIVISSSDPKSSHLAVKQLVKQGLRYDKWIQYWGDPLAIDIMRSDIWPQSLVEKKEKELLMDADKIVYVSPFTLREQQLLYPEMASRMVFHPIPYMEKEVFPETNNERFVIGYYGDYQKKKRNLIPFYQACVALGDSVDVSIYGNSKLKLESTDNVKIYPRGNVDEHKIKADLLICLLNSKGTQIPGKLYHFAGTNKKVLVLLDGDRQDEMKSFLENFDRFYICDNNKKSIQKAILEIMNDDRHFVPLESLKYDHIAAEMVE